MDYVGAMHIPSTGSIGSLVTVLTVLVFVAAHDRRTDHHGKDDLAAGLTTLYALDPLAARLSFGDGEYGAVFQDHQTRNRQSDIDFGQYRAGHFTVGVEGGRRGTIIDIGTATELQRRYAYDETVGNAQGFASIRIVRDEIVILEDSRRQTTQPLREARLVFEEGQAKNHAPVRLGHVYLVRILDAHDAAFERIVKLLVVEHSQAQTATIRWARIR